MELEVTARVPCRAVLLDAVYDDGHPGSGARKGG